MFFWGGGGLGSLDAAVGAVVCRCRDLDGWSWRGNFREGGAWWVVFCVGLAGGLLGLGASHSDDKEGSDKEALDKIRDGPNDLRQGCREQDRFR